MPRAASAIPMLGAAADELEARGVRAAGEHRGDLAPAALEPLSANVGGAGEAPPTRAVADATARRLGRAPRPSSVRPLKSRRTSVCGLRVPCSTETRWPSRRTRTSPDVRRSWRSARGSRVPLRRVARIRTVGGLAERGGLAGGRDGGLDGRRARRRSRAGPASGGRTACSSSSAAQLRPRTGAGATDAISAATPDDVRRRHRGARARLVAAVLGGRDDALAGRGDRHGERAEVGELRERHAVVGGRGGGDADEVGARGSRPGTAAGGRCRRPCCRPSRRSARWRPPRP